ncbi:MAG: hypothetical protein WCI51_17365 [Lentisphaerota bacterium]
MVYGRLYEYVVSFFSDSRKVMWLTLFFAVMSSLMHIFFNQNMYRDVAFCYAFGVQEAARGDWTLALDPGLPVLNMVLGGIVSLSGISAYQSLMIVSCVFFIATIFPLNALLKRFVSPLWASVGCLMFAIAPKIIRFSCTGLLESARNFFFILSFWLLCCLYERMNIRRSLWFAFAIAGLALARAEGLIISATFVILLILGALWNIRNGVSTGKVWKIIGYSLLVVFAFSLLVMPRILYNMEKTGYPSLDTRYHPYMDYFFHMNKIVKLPQDYPHPKAIQESAQAYKSKQGFDVLKQAKAVFVDAMRGAYELYLALAVIGIGFCVFRYRLVYDLIHCEIPQIVRDGWRLEYSAGAVLILVHCILYFADCSSYRYYTFISPLLLPFSLLPLFLILALPWPWKRLWRNIIVSLALITAVAQVHNGWSFMLAENGCDEAKYGYYLKQHAADFLPVGERDRRVRCYSDYAEAAFYSGFYITNNSLVCKSYRLQAEQYNFDVAIFQGDEPHDDFAVKYRLREVTHPFTGKFRLYCRK